MSSPLTHTPVLLAEVLRALDPHPGETYADCTAGLAGHAAAIAPALGPTGTIILNDADPANLESAAARVRALPNAPAVHPFRGNFADLPRKLAQANLKADLVLADLGFASNQMDDPARGFSFMREGPLDMRMDPSLPISARDLVNSAPEAELANLIFELGEDHAARRIARKLVQARARAPISTTTELAESIRDAVGIRQSKQGGIHPATKTFQALRIAVNDELGSLEALLAAVAQDARMIAGGGEGSWIRFGARIAVISFHSLEDRPVKRVFGELVREGKAADVSKGVVGATDLEIVSNPRARSAKLRVIEIGAAADKRARGSAARKQ